MALRIVIVERAGAWRHALARLLSTTPGMEVAGEADTIREVERLPPAALADVVLAGVDVIEMHGTAGIDRLLARFPAAQVVMIGSAEPGVVIDALRAGADGYLTRDTSADGVVRALQATARGEAVLPRTLIQLLVETVRLAMPRTVDESAIERLSRREREVLREIARGQSNAQIAVRLSVSESTVKTHVSNILRKTGSRSRFLFQAATPK